MHLGHVNQPLRVVKLGELLELKTRYLVTDLGSGGNLRLLQAIVHTIVTQQLEHSCTYPIQALACHGFAA